MALRPTCAPSTRRALLTPSWALALGAAVALAAPGCTSDDQGGLACPLLAPGATAALTAAPPLDAHGDTFDGTLPRGALAAHPVALASGQSLTVRLDLATAGPVLFTYGPRDAFGGYPHCLALAAAAPDGARAVTTTLTAAAAGEYLVLAGAPPGATPGAYRLTLTCLAGCDAPAPCPTLAARGCPDARCDGELTRDAAGCLSCACDPAALCGPHRAAGPAGSCVLPACACPDPAPAAPVCGTDGRTWPSTCHARCAGVAVAQPGACPFACPALASCDAPCFGLRALTADGCPSCACLPEFAADPASCAACPDAGAPVCGSDGVTYPSRCAARCAGARLLYAAACVAGCRAAPAECALDCPWGLRLAPDGPGCLSCACAPAPSSSCVPDGAPVCASLPALGDETTLGAPCLAAHLGADDGHWGPCGLPCVADDDCPDGARCATAGYLAARCLATAPPRCGCAAVIAPVCGADGLTRDNTCIAACDAVTVAHEGPCCTATQCPPSGAAPVDARGCPSGCPADGLGACADGAATAPACAPDGAALATDACRAHLTGEAAAPAWCAP